MSMAGLLVALCAINVATLLLLRAAGRAREMSMRYALGAKRSRIVSQLLVEGGLLGLAGAAAGLAFAPLVATALVRLITSADPGSEPYSTSIDARVLLFTLAISVVGQPAVQHCSGVSLPASRSRRSAAAELRNGIEELAAFPQSWRWARRSRSACCCSAARACLCAPSTTYAISPLASTPANWLLSLSIPRTPATAKIALRRLSPNALDASAPHSRHLLGRRHYRSRALR